MLVASVREDAGIGGVPRFRGELLSSTLPTPNSFSKGVSEGKACSLLAPSSCLTPFARLPSCHLLC